MKTLSIIQNGAKVILQQLPKKWMIFGVLFIFVLGVIAYWALNAVGSISEGSVVKVSASEVSSNDTLAVVNDEKITGSDIKVLLESGVDRAIAVDRTINKLLVANAARSLYPIESRDTLRSAERDLLSGLFLRLKRQELLDMISQQAVEDYYEKNITQQQFDTYKLKYYLTRDFNDAEQVKALLSASDKDALAKLEYFNKESPFVSLSALPYNLGRVIKESYMPTSKSRTILGPITVRDGYFIVMIEDFKPGSRPQLSSALGLTIREQLVENELSVVLTDLRKNAKISIQ